MRAESVRRLHGLLLERGDDLLALLVADAGLPVALAGTHLDAPLARLLDPAHAGQGCRLPATVVVPAGRYDEMVEVAARTMADIGIGHSSGPATVCGPVLSPVQRGRVLRYLALAEAEGGRFATGGYAVDRDGGWWIAPTVVAGLTAESRLVREEILGPVLVVLEDA